MVQQDGIDGWVKSEQTAHEMSRGCDADETSSRQTHVSHSRHQSIQEYSAIGMIRRWIQQDMRDT